MVLRRRRELVGLPHAAPRLPVSPPDGESSSEAEPWGGDPPPRGGTPGPRLVRLRFFRLSVLSSRPSKLCQVAAAGSPFSGPGVPSRAAVIWDVASRLAAGEGGIVNRFSKRARRASLLLFRFPSTAMTSGGTPPDDIVETEGQASDSPADTDPSP